jgi:hypothetical protein
LFTARIRPEHPGGMPLMDEVVNEVLVLRRERSRVRLFIVGRRTRRVRRAGETRGT